LAENRKTGGKRISHKSNRSRVRNYALRKKISQASEASALVSVALWALDRIG